MKRMKRVFAVLLAVLLLASAVPLTAWAENNTLTVLTGDMTGSFSPFFTRNAYDQDVWAMTQVSLLTTDRVGLPVYKGATGEKRTYNGKTYSYTGIADLTVSEKDGKVIYDFALRSDVAFSDGQKLTADDVIFSMYVLSDPTYDGTDVFYSLPIEGMAAYRAGMNSLQNLIYEAGEGGYASTSYYTEAQYDAFWAAFNKAGAALVDGICDYVIRTGYAQADDGIDEIAKAWGYWLPAGATKADFWNEIKAAYVGSRLTSIDMETGDSASFTSLLKDYLGKDAGTYAKGVKIGESADRITGIRKVDDYHVSVTMTEKLVTTPYLISVAVTPMHYYGSRAKYDYANNQFGFDKGDLSSVHAKDGAPMGAGPYKFVSFHEGSATFNANDKYYKGAPKIRNVMFRPAAGVAPVAALVSGAADIASPSYTTDIADEIRRANGLSAGSTDLSGSKIAARPTDNLGYGYVGISANVVNVGGVPGSAASKNLRKALATVLAVYRGDAADYYGGRAKVIEYPISSTSWAAPQPADAGYRTAFSLNAAGKDIYTAGMTQAQKEAAALEAALGFFKAAGYTVTDGKVTAAPAGAKMAYEILVPGGGEGDHPVYSMAQKASAALAKIGFTLTVNDLSNSSELWSRLDAEDAALWTAAWGSSADPDMYQIYFSGKGDLAPGGSNYMYDISDETLNDLILQARSSTDQAYRKQLYKQCLDIITDWAVEVPVYQRQNLVIFSAERIDLSTLPELTTYYGWMSEIETLRLRGGAVANDTVVEQGSTAFAAPGITAQTLLGEFESGARIEKADGTALKANETVGSGMVLVKADGSRETVVIKGDNDGDGKISTNDARNALRVAVGLDKPNDWQTAASLVVSSEKIGTADARGILRAAIGLDKLAIV